MGTNEHQSAEAYRARSSMWLVGGSWVLLAGLGAAAVEERGADAYGTLAFLLVLGYVAWRCFGHPSLLIGDDGVTLVNPFRTILVPWETLIDVRVRTGLTLVTPHGNHTSWAAPGQSSRPRGDAPPDASPAAQFVRERWTAMVESGALEAGLADETPVYVAWDRLALVELGALLVIATAAQVV